MFLGLCETYPKLLCVPSLATPALMMGSAAFRSKRRLPVLSYLHKNGAVIVRYSVLCLFRFMLIVFVMSFEKAAINNVRLHYVSIISHKDNLLVTLVRLANSNLDI